MASQIPFAPNPHSVRVRPIDYSHPQAPRAKTWHGILIVVNGNVVGRIQSWQPQHMQREGNHVYELNAATYGHPVDFVPGRATNFQFTCTRIEVWSQELEIALGYPAVWADLTDQDRPFEVQEVLQQGRVPYRIWGYTGCWFTDRNEDAFAVDGDTMVKTNSTVAFVNRLRLL